MMEFVSWDYYYDYSQYMEKSSKCSKPPTSQCSKSSNIWSLGDSSAIFEPTNVTVLPREDGETGLGTSRLLTAQGDTEIICFSWEKGRNHGFLHVFAIGSGEWEGWEEEYCSIQT